MGSLVAFRSGILPQFPHNEADEYDEIDIDSSIEDSLQLVLQAQLKTLSTLTDSLAIPSDSSSPQKPQQFSHSSKSGRIFSNEDVAPSSKSGAVFKSEDIKIDSTKPNKKKRRNKKKQMMSGSKSGAVFK